MQMFGIPGVAVVNIYAFFSKWIHLHLFFVFSCDCRYGGISVGAVNSQVRLSEAEVEDVFRDLKNLLSSSQVRHKCLHWLYQIGLHSWFLCIYVKWFWNSTPVVEIFERKHFSHGDWILFCKGLFTKARGECLSHLFFKKKKTKEFYKSLISQHMCGLSGCLQLATGTFFFILTAEENIWTLSLKIAWNFCVWSVSEHFVVLLSI